VDFVSEIRAGKRLNLLVMRTFSKIFGLAGLRLGYGIASPELITTLEKVRQPFNINSIAQAGALAALEDDDHTRKTRENNARGLRLYEATFQKLGLEYVPSSGNFILVRVGDGQRVFNEMQKLGVITRPMGGYQLGEWIRISVGTPAENERCIEALKKVLPGH
ncbi:MAG TPA: aminotransferase class I/II-fold pyridoxal phosphate-dependent enzyme, partial [Candidatus Paceibacterota bacterium]|nr:aminotransferase class I/II-fold pyridoxal phosphate-dependent enzyme [Candidatus Paceibacterota bacterium]